MYAGVLALVFLEQRRAFSIHFRVWTVAVVIGMILDAVLASAVLGAAPTATSFAAILRTVVSLIVWNAYLARSRRAAATFVR